MNLFITPLISLAAIACTPTQATSTQGTPAPSGAAPAAEAKPAQVSKVYAVSGGGAKPRAVVLRDGGQGASKDQDGGKHIVIHKSSKDGQDETVDVDMGDLHAEFEEMARNGEFNEAIYEMVGQGMAAGGGWQTGNGDLFAVAPVEYDDNAAFFGVGTTPVSAQTAAQLPLRAGTGLVVSHVVKDSPAAKAGLQANDVLSRMGDQLLVNAEQFAVLIRGNKPGDSVTVTYLRGGKEQTAVVTLAGKKLPKLRPGGQRASAGFNMDGGMMMVAPDASGQGLRSQLIGAAAAKADAEVAAAQAGRAAEHAAQAAEVAAVRARAARAPMARSINRAGKGGSTSVSEMRYNDDAAEILWSERDGKTHVKVVDHASGSTVYDADGTPDQKAMEGFSKDVRAAVESFMEDQAKVRSKRSADPADPLMPAVPAPPAQPGQPSPPSASMEGAEEPGTLG